MINMRKGEVQVPISQNRTLTLVFDFNTLCAAEDPAGKSWQEIGAEFEKGAPRLTTLRALIWAAAQKNHPNLSIEDVGDILQTDAEKVIEKMTEGMAAAMPEPEAEADADELDGADPTRPQ